MHLYVVLILSPCCADIMNAIAQPAARLLPLKIFQNSDSSSKSIEYISVNTPLFLYFGFFFKCVLPRSPSPFSICQNVFFLHGQHAKTRLFYTPNRAKIIRGHKHIMLPALPIRKSPHTNAQHIGINSQPTVFLRCHTRTNLILVFSKETKFRVSPNHHALVDNDPLHIFYLKQTATAQSKSFPNKLRQVVLFP